MMATRSGLTSLLALMMGLGLGACAANLPNSNLYSSAPGNPDAGAEALLQSARVSFDTTNFFTLINPNPNLNSKNCPGGAQNFYNPLAGTYPALGTAYPTLSFDSSMTEMPAFIKNISVDITDSNSTDPSNLALDCSLFTNDPSQPATACAAMGNTSDWGGIPYYTTIDTDCTGVGPIESSDPYPSASRTLAGGVYFDIDRTQLGPNENLMLTLTYFPLTPSNDDPSGTPITTAAAAFFKVHLKQTGLNQSTLQNLSQPLFLTFLPGSSLYPTLVDTLAILAPPGGSLRTDQILLPISASASIDEIRVERVSGSAILVDATLYRLGYR